MAVGNFWWRMSSCRHACRTVGHSLCWWCWACLLCAGTSVEIATDIRIALFRTKNVFGALFYPLGYVMARWPGCRCSSRVACDTFKRAECKPVSCGPGRQPAAGGGSWLAPLITELQTETRRVGGQGLRVRDHLRLPQ